MKYETGKRLKIIADSFFEGNLSELARNLEMTPQALAKYVKGESMPGGLILIRLHKIGVNINWFLTGEGRKALRQPKDKVSEPVQHYLSQIEEDLRDEEGEQFETLLAFSETISELDISPAMQRALLLVFAQHMTDEASEKSE